MEKIDLIEFCGGQKQVKFDFFKVINDYLVDVVELDKDNLQELANICWQAGFDSCVKVFVRAARKGDISIDLYRDGDTFRVGIPEN